MDGTTRYPPRDEQLHRRLVYGDESALGEAYDAFGGLVRSVALRVSGNVPAAEEITREVFTYLWVCPYAFVPGRGSLRTRLSMLAHRRALTRVRAAEPEAGAADARPDAADAGSGAAEVNHAAPERAVPTPELRLHRALAALPLPQQEATHLACFAGRNYRQIAVELGIPEDMARFRLRSALRGLTDRLAEAGHPGGPAGPPEPPGPARPGQSGGRSAG